MENFLVFWDGFVFWDGLGNRFQLLKKKARKSSRMDAVDRNQTVGQDDATRLGQASKSAKLLFASVGVQSSQRSQTEGNDRINSQRSHNLVEV
ncbi:hypothetical protein THAOC_00120 [Thalassiosira oceanica]|uniref:Uncharacterized protein n=1 Tax=Thalassiosira oceanica TaxID=159749 RepID=K0TRL5_THAOC|nr:hypothetical protein THAOC_00120 [Thalassiosira oceanica]|eukprot:EJK78007.1 hypothetical protein THAOC_00120 [Thalassiosira oceanica]